MSALIFISCDVSKWGTYEDCDEPEPPVERHYVTLNLVFDTDLPLHRRVTYSRAADGEDSRYNEAEHDIRYIVNIYAASRSKTDAPVATHVFTRPFSNELDYTTRIELPDGEYSFYAWTDYVDPGSQADKYYNTLDFEHIVLNETDTHISCNERRDAFHGNQQALIINSAEATPDNTVTVPMKRPMARFEFITTDFYEFMENEARNNGSNGRDPSAVNLSDYTVLFQYTGFMPSAYNIFENIPSDAWSKTLFRGEINPVDEGASLGFDYVFVNDVVESTISVVMAIYNKKGERIASTDAIDIPLMRSKNTIVTGEFLSAQGSGGVGIVPDYDNEYNVEF